MKNLTKTLFAAAITAVVFTSSFVSTFAAAPVATVITPRSAISINRIWVSGNVKIVLTQADKLSVACTDSYDSSKTSVTSKGQTMYIKSTDAGQVTLNITLKDLQRIVAYGQSVVVTTNNFDVKNLQLFLHDSAKAKIKTTAESLYTVVNGEASLKLSGTADESTMVASNMKNVKLNDFATLKSESYASEAIMKAQRTAMTLQR